MLYNGMKNCECGCNECDFTESTCGAPQMGGCARPMMNKCGCNQSEPMIASTPIYMPETVNYSHVMCCHEQPVIVPVEHRTVVHHGFTPRYYQTQTYTRQDIVEENSIQANNIGGMKNMGMGSNGCNGGCGMNNNNQY